MVGREGGESVVRGKKGVAMLGVLRIDMLIHDIRMVCCIFQFSNSVYTLCFNNSVCTLCISYTCRVCLITLSKTYHVQFTWIPGMRKPFIIEDAY